jgi:hypothetical protein
VKDEFAEIERLIRVSVSVFPFAQRSLSSGMGEERQKSFENKETLQTCQRMTDRETEKK